jgi:hypothetical protein
MKFPFEFIAMRKLNIWQLVLLIDFSKSFTGLLHFYKSKWLQGLNTHTKNQWIPNWRRKITHTHTHTTTYTHTMCRYTVGYLVSKFLNFHIELQRWTDQKLYTLLNSINSHNQKKRFSFKDSYSYLTVDILNECEIVGTRWIFINSKEISSLWHYGYYTHSSAHANIHTHTHTHTLLPWKQKER